MLNFLRRLLKYREPQWGTRLQDGTITGAPGVVFTPLPVCSRCQQAIDAEAKQNDSGKAEPYAEDARLRLEKKENPKQAFVPLPDGRSIPVILN